MDHHFLYDLTSWQFLKYTAQLLLNFPKYVRIYAYSPNYKSTGWTTFSLTVPAWRTDGRACRFRMPDSGIKTYILPEQIFYFSYRNFFTHFCIFLSLVCQAGYKYNGKTGASIYARAKILIDWDNSLFKLHLNWQLSESETDGRKHYFRINICRD